MRLFARLRVLPRTGLKSFWGCKTTSQTSFTDFDCPQTSRLEAWFGFHSMRRCELPPTLHVARPNWLQFWSTSISSTTCILLVYRPEPDLYMAWGDTIYVCLQYHMWIDPRAVTIPEIESLFFSHVHNFNHPSLSNKLIPIWVVEYQCISKTCGYAVHMVAPHAVNHCEHMNGQLYTNHHIISPTPLQQQGTTTNDQH